MDHINPLKKESQEADKFFIQLLEDAKIPDNRILYLHVKLRNIQTITNCSYKDLSISLINTLNVLFRPKTILIPVFTYSFTKSGIFHKLFSMSEVGRFSEEIRQGYLNFRTPDPVFSVIDINSYLLREEFHINYEVAFGMGCLFEYLNKENCIFINIGLDEMISTQFHYIEKINNVPYRYDKIFNGIVYYNENSFKNINYTYYVRDLKLDPKWNRPKIEHLLIDKGSLNLTIKEGIRILWFSACDSAAILNEKIKEDEAYLIT